MDLLISTEAPFCGNSSTNPSLSPVNLAWIDYLRYNSGIRSNNADWMNSCRESLVSDWLTPALRS